MSRHRKIIAVVGATGAQGGGLVRAILNDPQHRFHARAITRKPHSTSAKIVKQLGAEVVKADIDDFASIREAFRGASAAYCVTNYWEHFSPEREVQQARNMAKAARDEALEHVVWSTLEDTRDWVSISDDHIPTLMGKYKVPHFDGKGEANREFTDRHVPTTFMLTSFYWDNLLYPGSGPERDADGVLTFTLPMGDQPMPGIASSDIGKCAFGIFRSGANCIGRTIGVAGEHLTGDQMTAAMSRAVGEPVLYNAVEPSVYAGYGFPGAADLANMYQFKRDFNDRYCAVRDLERARRLNPDLLTFAGWLTKHQGQIPV